MSGKSGSEVSFGTVRITELDYKDDALILAETTEVLAETLESLSEEADPNAWWLSWIKVQAFDDILVATVASILVGGENVT